jgi:RNA polymerase sigma factor (sigma-70 family)
MRSAPPFELWDEFISGNHSCFGKLFRGFYSGLYGYGLKLCNDPGLVEDCIQNLFVSVWERRFELNHITSPNVYLFVSLRRNLIKARKKKDHEIGITEEVQENISIQFGAEEIIVKRESKKELQAELQKAMTHLSNQQKEVLYLHFYNGMSYGEIEEILSINRQSVRNHMYWAMETLRSLLDIDVMRLVIALALGLLYSMQLFI